MSPAISNLTRVQPRLEKLMLSDAIFHRIRSAKNLSGLTRVSLAVWILVWSGMLALVVSFRSSVHDGESPAVTDLGTTLAMHTPAIMHTASSTEVLWRPLQSETPLQYRSLTSPTIVYDILPYTDLSPRRWQTGAARQHAFHLVWSESDARLRMAHLDETGHTLRGPVDLAQRARQDFSLLTLADGNAAVIWADPSTGNVFSTQIDLAGRVGPKLRILPKPTSAIASCLDAEDIAHLVWLTSTEPNSWNINYQVSDPKNLQMDQPQVLHSLVVEPTKTLSAFEIGLDHTFAYIFWSITDVNQPAVEKVFVLAFPIGHSSQATLRQLWIPRAPGPRRVNTTSESPIGRLGPVDTEPGSPAALRWPRPARGQHDLLPVSMSGKTEDGWHPIVVYFQHGEPLGFQAIASQAADAGPPQVDLSPGGDTYLAWLGLEAATPHLYVARINGPGPKEETQKRISSTDVVRGIVGIPYGSLWLVIPALLVLGFRPAKWIFLAASFFYVFSKLFWPPGLYEQTPPLLVKLGSDSSLAISLATMSIALGGIFAMSLCRHDRQYTWRSWLAFGLVDMSLTWAIFGANIL
jgi:hypothetical protein